MDMPGLVCVVLSHPARIKLLLLIPFERLHAYGLQLTCRHMVMPADDMLMHLEVLPRKSMNVGRAHVRRGGSDCLLAICAAGRSPPRQAQVPAVPVGAALRIFWKDDDAWYQGRVTHFDGSRHQIEYEDGETELLKLADERYELMVPGDALILTRAPPEPSYVSPRWHLQLYDP